MSICNYFYQWIGILAFGIIYVVWGANFIAIRFAIESIPPFLMAGTRFFIAGLLIYIWLRSNGENPPTFQACIPSIKLGIWLNVLGTGGLVWAEQFVPSGIAAIVLATVPVWMVILDTKKRKQNLSNPAISTGLCLGIVGVIFLSDYSTFGYLTENSKLFYIGILVLALGTICWAKGSIFSKTIGPEISLPMSLSIQMISAGILLYLIGVQFDEHTQFIFSQVTLTSLLALLFLIVFGSIIGYLAYLWLLKEYSPALVGTYAYVHPLVAVLLGWMLANEQITAKMMLSLLLILGAVFSIKYAHPKSEKNKLLIKAEEIHDCKNLARSSLERKR